MTFAKQARGTREELDSQFEADEEIPIGVKTAIGNMLDEMPEDVNDENREREFEVVMAGELNEKTSIGQLNVTVRTV